jgi:hypothetical protein
MTVQATPSRTVADLWVDNLHYFGPDRRRAFGLVPREERRVLNSTSEPPSLWSALRKLRFHVLDAYGQAGLKSFIERTRCVAELAEKSGEPQIWEELTGLAWTLSTSPADKDMRSDAFREIERICAQGSAAVTATR